MGKKSPHTIRRLVSAFLVLAVLGLPGCLSSGDGVQYGQGTIVPLTPSAAPVTGHAIQAKQDVISGLSEGIAGIAGGVIDNVINSPGGQAVLGTRPVPHAAGTGPAQYVGHTGPMHAAFAPAKTDPRLRQRLRRQAMGLEPDARTRIAERRAAARLRAQYPYNR